MPNYLVWDHDTETAEDANYIVEAGDPETAIEEFADGMDDRGSEHTIRAREVLRDTIYEAVVKIVIEPVVYVGAIKEV